MYKFFTLAALFMLQTTVSLADAIHYEIIEDRSKVGFTYTFGKDAVDGKFQDYDAILKLDFETAKNSFVDVRLSTTTAQAGFAFATQALKSKKVLDAKTYPDIHFISSSVRATGKGTATVDGNITVRGITKPIQLTAQLLRDPGTLASERDDLRIRLTGTLNRTDFGANGFAKEVGEILAINIDARIKRIGDDL